MRAYPTLLLLSLSMAVAGCATITEHQVGKVNGELQSCPSAPRCVSSDTTDDRHQIDALLLAVTPDVAWPVVVETVKAMPRTTLVVQEQDYLRAEIISPWAIYTDDLELLLDSQGRRIAVRSTGRIGYYDFNVNRERVEALRQRLSEEGVVKPLRSD